MKIFETVYAYLEVAKEGDYIALAGYGIMDGIRSVVSKYDVYKVHGNTTKDKLVIRAYRGRTNLILGYDSYDQKIALYSREEFNSLEI